MSHRQENGGIPLKKALFWDFDGTLIYGEATFYNALKSALSALNYDVPSEEITHNLMTGCTWHTYDVTYIDSTGEKWWERLFEHFALLYAKYDVTLADAKEINRRFKAEILDYNTYTVYDDAAEVLQKCREMGFENYVVSNNYPELRMIAHSLGLTEYIEEFIVSANIGYEKPRPEIFRYAMRAAGFPDVYFMIGDNPVADVQGGKAAGMKTILVHTQGDYGADHNCKTLSEIPELL